MTNLSVSLSCFLSPHSPGTWASLVPFQVSNGTPILPTNVHHQNYSINIIGEPLVPAETGNWATQRPGWAPGWMGVGGAELALQVSAAMDETSKAAGAAQSSPSSSRPAPLLPRPSPWRTLAVKWRRGLVQRERKKEIKKRTLQVCCVLARARPTHPPPTSQLLCLQNFSIHSNTVMYRCLNVLLHDTLVS